ncbi:hypothetical protein H0H93_005853 [Arthromyces matolae]|nr:hypothetical protein H0H93_005853 [Arthromyces matolae]
MQAGYPYSTPSYGGSRHNVTWAATVATNASEQTKYDTLNHKKSASTLANDISRSLAKINASMTSLAALQTKFTFPDKIDIVDTGSLKNPFDLIPHTRHNERVHRYIMALHDLRTDLGTVKSYHDSNVRISRSLAIGRIEAVLQSLEHEIEKRVKRLRKGHSKAKVVGHEKGPDERQYITPHIPNSVPIPPLPSREVCRKVGGDIKFAKAFKEMANTTTNLQLNRLKAIARGSTTSKWDEELVTLSKRWNGQVDEAVKIAKAKHDKHRTRVC